MKIGFTTDTNILTKRQRGEDIKLYLYYPDIGITLTYSFTIEL